MFRSNEKIPSTRICDIFFEQGEVEFLFRDPQHLRCKRENRKSLASYGVIGRFDQGNGQIDAFDLVKVDNSLIQSYK